MKANVLLAACLATSVGVAACGSSHPAEHAESTMPSRSDSSSSMPMPSKSMPSESMPVADGLSLVAGGYALKLVQQPSAGKPVRFTITHGGTTVTDFDTEQTVRMHLYLISSNLDGYQHVHPAMDAEGIWSAALGTLPGGAYRLYTQFVPHAGAQEGPLVLSQEIDIDGPRTPTMTMPPQSVALIDGYKVELTQQIKDGSATMLALTFSKSGKPVTDLQPYLDTYAHVTAIREHDLAFAHLHPGGTAHGDHGGPALTFHAEFPETGTYRLFVQFQTVGHLHTAVLGLTAS